MNLTNLTDGVREVTPSQVGKDLIFLSSWIANKLLIFMNEVGLPLKDYQIRVAGTIIDIILIIIVIKAANRIGNPILIAILLLLLLYFLIGFII